MKKMLFLMLFLMILGAANVSAQVRIGGNGQPNPAAVLDLNADNSATGTKGLALPRVSLTDVNTALTGSPTVNGMLVFNVSGSLSTGIYYWDTSKWVKVSDGTFVEGDGIVGNEIVDATANGGLVRAGSGTTAAPYTLGIAPKGIATVMIGDGTVTADKLSPLSEPGSMLMFNGTKWVPWLPPSEVARSLVTCTACPAAEVGKSVTMVARDSSWFSGNLGRCAWSFDSTGSSRCYMATNSWDEIRFWKMCADDRIPAVQLFCAHHFD